MQVLLIDIGNSRIKWRIVDPRLDWPQHDDAAAISASDVSGSLALCDLSQLAQRFGATRIAALDSVHMSNVAGAEVEIATRTAISTSWGDVPVHSLIPDAAQCGVINGYRDKPQLGADRWAAMLGAHALSAGGHLLVCSFGTATTIDLLLIADHETKRASFDGGLILPGFDAMRRALARDTARLPLAEGEVFDFATRTDDAIASGIVAAQAGAVTRSVHNARARIAIKDRDRGAPRPLSLMLAGGVAKAMAAHLDGLDAPLRIVPDLVLRGLHAIAYDRQPPGVFACVHDHAHHAPLVHERS